jgi:hypothetical protein
MRFRQRRRPRRGGVLANHGSCVGLTDTVTGNAAGGFNASWQSRRGKGEGEGEGEGQERHLRSAPGNLRSCPLRRRSGRSPALPYPPLRSWVILCAELSKNSSQTTLAVCAELGGILPGCELRCQPYSAVSPSSWRLGLGLSGRCNLAGCVAVWISFNLRTLTLV